MTLEGIRLSVIRSYIKYTAKYRRKKLKNTNFTIISNNCWGGKIYQSYNLPYQSPTIGLFIMAEDYIKFIYDIKRYMNKKLEFISPEKSKYAIHFKKWSKFGTYPIGILEDVEIHFLHYHSKEEAKEKWERRAERINWDRIIFKFNDQNLCTEKLLQKFSELPENNKICFTSKPYELPNAIYIKMWKKYEEIQASYEPFGKSKYKDINELINNLR